MPVTINYQMKNLADIPDMGRAIQTGLNIGLASAKMIADFAIKEVKKYTPRVSGYMADHVRAWDMKVIPNSSMFVKVGWRGEDFTGMRAFYPAYVLSGTGLYGQYHKMILPNNRRGVFVFKKPTGEFVVTKAIKGQRANDIFTKAEPAIMSYIWSLFGRSVEIGCVQDLGGRKRG